ncbi:MAG: hypothetical protein KKH54_12360, partial [Alphaproteobacteria bacterium]|nr:hypothetical protein [Alphaproteobacteria bacterium]
MRVGKTGFSDVAEIVRLRHAQRSIAASHAKSTRSGAFHPERPKQTPGKASPDTAPVKAWFPLNYIMPGTIA